MRVQQIDSEMIGGCGESEGPFVRGGGMVGGGWMDSNGMYHGQKFFLIPRLM